MANLLVVDDEKSMRDMLRIVFRDEGHEVLEAADGKEGLEVFQANEIDLVVQDLRMPRMDGLQLLQAIKDTNADVPVIVITAFGDWQSAVEAMRLGAFDYIKKPFDTDLIRSIIARALEQTAIRKMASKGPIDRVLPPMEFIGNTPSMRDIFRLIGTVAQTNTTVLIRGESGTGKELVARSIHFQSMRGSGPFIATNCGALPESLLESELFGHLKGTFTGAIANKRGLLEAASGGTFFLDEVGDLSPATQVKLLRVLEDRTVTPVGGTEPRRIDLRFVTATNKDLEKEVKEGRFRDDLFYRLNVIPILLPPLRDRREDIPLLAGHFLARYTKEMGKTITQLEPRSMDRLMAYRWPGNIREMQNLIHRAVALASDENTLTVEIPPGEETEERDRILGVSIPDEGIDLDERLESIEKLYLEEALRRGGGKMTQAAKILGLSFRSMRYKVKKYGLKDVD
ncbi:MAG: sigma-54 dependent transcriptional regulator [Planctomycetota bacterium]|nr:sigma-54 dependent transcriptional regulator [Planctomycetota bacterium]